MKKNADNRIHSPQRGVTLHTTVQAAGTVPCQVEYSSTFDSLSQLDAVAQGLLDTFADERFFAFFGSMGVGKTTLIKALCRALGSDDNVCSPTFAIVNEYTGGDGKAIYHFDFYRLKSIDEAYDIGYEEYFYSGCHCFTEWTEKIEPLLPERHVRVEMAEQDGVRTLKAELISN